MNSGIPRRSRAGITSNTTNFKLPLSFCPPAPQDPCFASRLDPGRPATKSGTGTIHPKASDTVTVHYHGKLLDGTVFDSSVERGQPASFPLNQVIPGWTEGVQLMKQGDKFKFTIPANLAYGANSPSPLIPPNSTLVFEVELLKIN